MNNLKIFSCKLILICFLAILNSGTIFSKSSISFNVENKQHELFSTINSSLSLLEDLNSKLTENKKGIKRSYQNDMDSIPLGSSEVPVEIHSYSTVHTNNKLMDVKTVQQLGIILSEVNKSQDLSLKNIENSVEELNILLTISVLERINRQEEFNRRRKLEAQAYLTFPLILILSLFTYLYCTHTNRPIARNWALGLLIVSLLATIYYSSHYIFLFSKVGDVMNILNEEQKVLEIFASFQ